MDKARLAILHLTIYEADIALWKEERVGRVDWATASSSEDGVIQSQCTGGPAVG
ncbi:hypothetical protein [Pyrobaculum sp.]|uniref:hypothetical protein n=1 Tax=Pyrobaculum sp. TaxID=2004705 RepID=UPI003164AFB8